MDKRPKCPQCGSSAVIKEVEFYGTADGWNPRTNTVIYECLECGCQEMGPDPDRWLGSCKIVSIRDGSSAA